MGTRGPQPVLTKAKIVRAIFDSGGIYESIAKKLGVRRETIMDIIGDDEVLQELRKQEHQRMLDIAEAKLFNAIKMGESYAISFFLRTRGRDRGYTEKTEITTPRDEPIEININVPGLENKQPVIDHHQTIALQFNIGDRNEGRPAGNQCIPEELPIKGNRGIEQRWRQKQQILLDNTVAYSEDVPGEEEKDFSLKKVPTKLKG
jgi:hypothetical protein